MRLVVRIVAICLLVAPLGFVSSELAALRVQRKDGLLPRVPSSQSLLLPSLRLTSTAAAHPAAIVLQGAHSALALAASGGSDGFTWAMSVAGQAVRPFLSVRTNAQSVAITADGLRTRRLNVDGAFTLGGVPQWRLVAAEHFHSARALVTHWSPPQSTSSCGGVTMLGGHCKLGKGAITRIITGISVHTKVRLRGVFHFIDRWVGETAYAKLNVGAGAEMVPVWTQRHAAELTAVELNVCGSENVGEGRFAVPIDVIIPHTQSALTLMFGSTIGSEDACDASWGVSSVELYVV